MATFSDAEILDLLQSFMTLEMAARRLVLCLAEVPANVESIVEYRAEVAACILDIDDLWRRAFEGEIAPSPTADTKGSS